jgi:hypothetical protein
MFSIQLQQAQSSYAPYPRKLHDPGLHIEVPAQKLTDRVDLVIVTAMRKAHDLGPKILQRRRPLGQPNMTSFSAGGLRMQTGDLVIPGQERSWIGDAMMLRTQLLDQ